MKRTIIGFIFLLIGTMMMIRATGIMDLDWFFSADWKKYIVPGIIMLIGIKILFAHRGNSQNIEDFTQREIPEMGGNDRLKVSACFTGYSYNFANKAFPGAHIDTFMGGVNLDLREAIIEQDCTIDVHACMGGVDIRMPEDVNVIINSNCLMGGISNKLPVCNNINSKTIRINANCFLGGIELKG